MLFRSIPVSYKTSRPYNTQTICINCDNMKLKRKSSQELVNKANKVSKCNTPEPIKEPEDPIEKMDLDNNQSDEIEFIKGSEMIDSETPNYRLITGKLANQIFSGQMHNDVLLQIHFWLAQSNDFEGLTNLILVNKHNYNTIRQQTILYNMAERIRSRIRICIPQGIG